MKHVGIIMKKYWFKDDVIYCNIHCEEAYNISNNGEVVLSRDDISL